MGTNTDPPKSSLETLANGDLALQGEFLWGSNYTYLVRATQNQNSLKAVYKPTRGTRPLWDFPPASLARREVAAYLLSVALGWGLVPPTVYRRDGPYGPGSVQLYIEHDPEYHYFNFTDVDRARLRPVVLFDLLVNNADRKGSHVLVDPEKHIWLIDHGICFHVEDKLRTVIWDFAGEGIPSDLCDALAALRSRLEPLAVPPSGQTSGLAAELRPYLSAGEITALARRADRLVSAGCFPNPDPSRRQYPWPPV
jgi:hypothetical protein